MDNEIIVTDEEVAEAGRRPRWYFVHTNSGFEQRVEKTVNELHRTGRDGGLIEQCIVPTEKVIELSRTGTAPRTTTRKLYPGYVMIRMTMTELSWNLIQSIPKVTGFIGGKNRPTPMKDEEAERILEIVRAGTEEPRPKFSFERGEEVRIIDGPFSGFNAIVDEVFYEKPKLRVTVSIFGRQTPVELDFVQVSKG